ncbi:hypothetical protein FSP39_016733 [Pinctada imbricata]|uniref:Uncharacterized protein n=1 Tax=Pinctada imbricata TaxID=66713 RepID=A0AA89BU91_PINIB|nr:hypothetical protein FSP39_016733 [Pinctada imbricata]
MSTSVVKKDNQKTEKERRQSMMNDATAKTDGAPNRRKSIYPVGDRKQSLEPPHGGARRPSMDARRPSQSDRKQSIVESNAGRSTLIMTSATTQRPNVKYENTYKLEPDKKYKSDEVKRTIKEVLEKELDGVKYDKDKCTGLTKTIAESIKRQVKVLGFVRYKLVVVVAIGQQEDAHPSVAFTSRCIWNEQMDNFSEYIYKSPSLFAVGLVYAMSFD